MTTISVPASTCNLGPGFDSHGLALQLFLTIEVEPSSDPFGSFLFEGEGADELRSDAEENLIFKTMRFAADAEGVALRPARLRVKNQIPLARGLGSSGAAIIGGLAAFQVVADHSLSSERMLEYAARIEGHADNVAAALYGSFVVSCIGVNGEISVAKLNWPEEVKAVVVIPGHKVRTDEARAVLPAAVTRSDAVFNVQHSSLTVAAIVTGRFDLLREAMRDRLHQPYRAHLVPGLEEVLSLELPGLLGIALSGSGPTVVGFATADIEAISSAISERFEAHGVITTSTVLSVAETGLMIY